MAEKLPIAFAAGLLSVLTPCVLPLVPGYLAAVSAVDVTALGTRGSVRKVVTSSLPFIAGLTAVFVPLGAAAAAIATVLPKTSQNEIAGFILVVIGMAFMGLLPLPKAIIAPGLLQSARRTGSSALLGGAFAVCAAPCIGTVLGSILVLASSSGTIVRGIILLVAYSLGLGAAFLIAGIAFARAMRAFRWVRDHFTVVQACSGSVLVVFGLLLFFHRDFWLRDGLNQLLSHVGLGTL